MIDYQWPHAEMDKNAISSEIKEFVKNVNLYSKIESFFSELFQTHVILMPSGRASISLLIKYFKTNRSHIVFAPKWTSHCVWDMITRFANPTIDCSDKCDTIIAVHKWGNIEKLNKQYAANIIEDSVDSIVINYKSFFPNNGDFEIISLPKIIGSYTGGLILVKNKEKADALRSYIIDDIELGKHQSRLRLQYSIREKPEYFHWEDRENQNTTLDTIALKNIENSLKNFNINKDIISKRLDLVSKIISSTIENDRLPPVFCVEIKNADIHPDIMIRNKNFSGFIDLPEFRKVGLIPLHFKASDELFLFCLNALCKN